MKKKLVLTAAVIAALSVVSCNGKKTNSQGANQDSLSYAENDSLNSNDVILDSIAGTYEGTLPAADCPGIETTLTLNPDKTLTLHSVYIDRDSSFDEKGTYTLEGNILTLKEEGGEISYYKVEENKVRLLNDDKQEITGALAEHYILNKE